VKALTRPQQFNRAVLSAPKFGLDVKIIWPEGPDINSFEDNPNALLNAANLAAKSTFKMFDWEAIAFPGIEPD